MRIILSIIVALGFTMIAIGLFQRASEVARWSQIYGIMDATAKDNPLRNEETRRRFDALYFQDTRIASPQVFVGGLTAILAIGALFLVNRSQNEIKSANKTVHRTIHRAAVSGESKLG